MRKPRVADQLGEHAAGAERDERAEDRILDDARRAARRRRCSIGCTITAPPMRSAAARDRRRRREVERDAARLGLVGAGASPS